MNKKIIILLILFLLVPLVACKSESQKDITRMYNLLDDKKYNEKIYMKTPYPEDHIEESEYLETNLNSYISSYLEILSNYSVVNKVSTDNYEQYLVNETNRKTILIESYDTGKEFKVYINENGKVIVNVDNTLYATEESEFDYKLFSNFHKLNDLIGSIDINRTLGINQMGKVNNLYSYIYIGGERLLKLDSKWNEYDFENKTYAELADLGLTKDEYIEIYRSHLYSQYYISLLKNYYVLKQPFYTYTDEMKPYHVKFYGEDATTYGVQLFSTSVENARDGFWEIRCCQYGGTLISYTPEGEMNVYLFDDEFIDYEIIMSFYYKNNELLENELSNIISSLPE